MENLVETNKVSENYETHYNRRWYDNKTYTSNVLSVLKTLSIRSHYEISREVIRVVESIKQHNREMAEIPLSIGLERVLGLYQE